MDNQDLKVARVPVVQLVLQGALGKQVRMVQQDLWETRARRVNQDPTVKLVPLVKQVRAEDLEDLGLQA